jgi:hypothetical protein
VKGMSDPIEVLVEAIKDGLNLKWDGSPPEPDRYGILRREGYAALTALAERAKEAERERDLEREGRKTERQWIADAVDRAEAAEAELERLRRVEEAARAMMGGPLTAIRGTRLEAALAAGSEGAEVGGD